MTTAGIWPPRPFATSEAGVVADTEWQECYQYATRTPDGVIHHNGDQAWVMRGAQFEHYWHDGCTHEPDCPWVNPHAGGVIIRRRIRVIPDDWEEA